MEEEAKIPEPEKLEQLIRENIKLTENIHRMSKRMNRYITAQIILSVIYFLLIGIPLILGAIYFPYFMKNVVNPYRKLLDSGNSLQNAVNDPSQGINDIVNQAQKLLKEKNNK